MCAAASFQDTSTHWAALQGSNLLEMESRQPQGKFLPIWEGSSLGLSPGTYTPAGNINTWIEEDILWIVAESSHAKQSCTIFF